jgi:hypothetical protein
MNPNVYLVILVLIGGLAGLTALLYGAFLIRKRLANGYSLARGIRK